MCPNALKNLKHHHVLKKNSFITMLVMNMCVHGMYVCSHVRYSNGVSSPRRAYQVCRFRDPAV